MTALRAFSLPMPRRTAEVTERVADSLASFVFHVQANEDNFRFQSPRRWHAEIVNRWCHYLEAIGRADLAMGDSELRAWLAAVAVPEVIEQWLPSVADRWKRRASPGSYAVRDPEMPSEPLLRPTTVPPFVLDSVQARMVSDARLHALRAVNSRADQVQHFEVCLHTAFTGPVPILQRFAPAPWEATAAAEFNGFVQARAPHGIPAHLLNRLAIRVADEALLRRQMWHEGTPAVPDEEIR